MAFRGAGNLLCGEALFLRRTDQMPILDQRRRAVVIEAEIPAPAWPRSDSV